MYNLQFNTYYFQCAMLLICLDKECESFRKKAIAISTVCYENKKYQKLACHPDTLESWINCFTLYFL